MRGVIEVRISSLCFCCHGEMLRNRCLCFQVSLLSGRSRRVLYSELDQPSLLVLDPRRGYVMVVLSCLGPPTTFPISLQTVVFPPNCRISPYLASNCRLSPPISLQTFPYLTPNCHLPPPLSISLSLSPSLSFTLVTSSSRKATPKSYIVVRWTELVRRQSASVTESETALSMATQPSSESSPCPLISIPPPCSATNSSGRTGPVPRPLPSVTTWAEPTATPTSSDSSRRQPFPHLSTSTSHCIIRKKIRRKSTSGSIMVERTTFSLSPVSKGQSSLSSISPSFIRGRNLVSVAMET